MAGLQLICGDSSNVDAFLRSSRVTAIDELRAHFLLPRVRDLVSWHFPFVILIRRSHCLLLAEFPLENQTVRVGRGEANELRIKDDGLISELHAIITNGVIADVGSTNGTDLNGQPVWPRSLSCRCSDSVSAWRRSVSLPLHLFTVAPSLCSFSSGLTAAWLSQLKSKAKLRAGDRVTVGDTALDIGLSFLHPFSRSYFVLAKFRLDFR